jgi:hypothetical protein
MTPELRTVINLCDKPNLRTERYNARCARDGSFDLAATAGWLWGLMTGNDCERAVRTPAIKAAAAAAFESLVPAIIEGAEQEERLRYLLPRIAKNVAVDGLSNSLR